MNNYDKLLHFLVGAVITACAMLFMPRPLAMLGTAAVAISKELWDLYNPPHVADWEDVLATLLGSVFFLTMVHP